MPLLPTTMPDHRPLVAASENGANLPIGVRMILASSMTILGVSAFFWRQRYYSSAPMNEIRDKAKRVSK
jgi:hypothetical protein